MPIITIIDTACRVHLVSGVECICAADSSLSLLTLHTHTRTRVLAIKVAQDYMPEPFMQVAILDTNFLISNLAYLRTLTSQAAKYHGSLVLVVPWIVVKELDGLKVGR